MSTINLNLSLSVTDSGNTVAGSAGQTFTSTNEGFIGNEQVVGTTAEVLLFGDVGTPAAVFVQNLDETNFVQIDSASAMTSFPQKLLPGQATVIYPETGTIYAKADTAACKIWVVAG